MIDLSEESPLRTAACVQLEAAVLLLDMPAAEDSNSLVVAAVNSEFAVGKVVAAAADEEYAAMRHLKPVGYILAVDNIHNHLDLLLAAHKLQPAVRSQLAPAD